MLYMKFTIAGVLFTLFGLLLIFWGSTYTPERSELTSIEIEGALEEEGEEEVFYHFVHPDMGPWAIYKFNTDNHQAVAEALRRPTLKHALVFEDPQRSSPALFELKEEQADGSRTTICRYEACVKTYKDNDRGRVQFGFYCLIVGPLAIWTARATRRKRTPIRTS